jgi:tape measure domain-containing protein
MTPEQRALILLELRGGPQYVAGMNASAAATRRLNTAVGTSGLAMQTAARRTFLMNQAMFTFRRYAFYGTLAITAMVTGLVKLGTSYLSAMQQARVALGPVIKDHATLEAQLKGLFTISKNSPFVISDLTRAFSAMYIAMAPIGISADTITRTLQSTVNYLSVLQQTTPMAMRRVTNALTDMANQGTLTGRMFNRLGQIGIPMARILNQQFGISGDQLKNISSLGLSALDVLNAINKGAQSPGIRNAALRLSLHSVHGQIQNMRDSLSQLMGFMIGGPGGDRGPWAAWQKILFDLVRPGGTMERLTNIAGRRGLTGVLMELSNMLTGSGGVGRGMLLLVSIGQNIGRIFATSVVPALVIGANSLVVFAPILYAVNALLGTAARHGNVLRWVLVPLAAAFLLSHTAMIGMWTAGKLVNIMLLGEAGLVRSLFRSMLLLLTVEGRQIVASKLQLLWGLRNVANLKKWAFATVWLRNSYGTATTKILANNSAAAKAVRVMFLLTNATKKAAVTTWLFTTALLSNPITWIALAVVGLGVALYLVIFRFDLVKRKLQDLVGWLRRNSIIWRLISWATGGGNSGAKILPAGGMSNPVTGGGGYGLANSPITPLISPSSTTPSPIPSTAMGGGGNDKPIIVQLHVNRKILAQEVARANADTQARR